MASWNDLLKQFDRRQGAGITWLRTRLIRELKAISKLRNDANVIFYASAFLQKPGVPAPNLLLSAEEINGFMSVMVGMDWSKNLVLLLHTPGGNPNAAETVVSYLWSKFDEIEVVVPTYAMSAGTMIALAANGLVMGRQSQLGPIDPQLVRGGVQVSARSIVDQFERARKEIKKDASLAPVWAPMLHSLGPGLLVEAENAMSYGESTVKGWLEQRMFAGKKNSTALAKAAAKHFGDASKHKSHGRRIERDEARQLGLNIADLEADQTFQDHVLTAYHMITLAFEKSPATRMLVSHTNRMWLKNFVPPAT